MSGIEWQEEIVVIPAHSGRRASELLCEFHGLKILAPQDFLDLLSIEGVEQSERRLLTGWVTTDKDHVPTISSAIRDVFQYPGEEAVNCFTIADHILEIGKSGDGLDEAVIYAWISGQEDRGSDWHETLIILHHKDEVGCWQIDVYENVDINYTTLPLGARLAVRASCI